MKKVTSYYEAESDEELLLSLGKRLNPELFSHWDATEDLLNDYLMADLVVVDANIFIDVVLRCRLLPVAQQLEQVFS